MCFQWSSVGVASRQGRIILLPMVISDLDRVHHPAELVDSRIRVRHLDLTIDEFTLSGLVLVSYSEEEEVKLERLGLLAPRSNSFTGAGSLL